MLLALWNCSSTNRATIPTRHSMTEQLSVTWPRSLQTLDSRIFSLLGNLHTARNNMASTGINDIWRKHIPSGSQAWMRATFLTSSCCASMPYASYAKCTTLRLCNVQVQHFGPARFRFFSRRSWQQHIHGYVQHDWRGLLWDSFSIFSFITPSSDSWQAASSDQAGHAPLRTRCTCLRHGIQNLPHTAKDLARTAQPLGPGSAKVEQLNAALSMREWTAHFTWKHWAFWIRHGCWHAGTVTKAQWTCSKKDSLICSVPLLVSMPWRTIIARTGEKATRIHRSKDSSMFNTWMRLIQVSYLINLKVTQGKSANASLVHHAMPDVPPMLEVKCLWYAWGLLMTTKWIRTSDDFAWQYMFDLRLWTEQCSCTQSISLPRLGGYFEIPEPHCEYVD